jgi:ribosomal protein S18 acetylase RimI-like enzyme
MGGLAVRIAGRADVREAADVLARAFHDDPMFSWVLPVEDTRNRRLRRYFVTELRHESLRHGGVEVARDSGRIAGVAVWFPPGTWTGTGVGALPGYLMAFGRRVGACARYASVAVRAHPREQPHWYLAMIGVDPSRQGRGAGAALLRSRLERCDQDGIAAYLESSKPQNVPLYEHFGFQITGVLDLPEGAPAVTTMWRPVQPLQPRALHRTPPQRTRPGVRTGAPGGARRRSLDDTIVAVTSAAESTA